MDLRYRLAEPTTGSRRSDLGLMGGRGEQVAQASCGGHDGQRMNTKKNQSRLATIKHSRAMRPVIPVVRLVRRASRRGPKRARRELTRVRTKAQNVWWPRLRGRPTIPPPHAYKESVVLAYASRFGPRLFIETGTLHGDMVEATRDAFEHVWSIELDEALWNAAVERFRAYPQVTIVHGDSATALPEIVRDQADPILYWLDGHWSGGVTARGSLDTPLLAELTTVLARGNANDVILIDDARLFGTGDYPSLKQVAAMVAARQPAWKVAARDDIVRVHRPG